MRIISFKKNGLRYNYIIDSQSGDVQDIMAKNFPDAVNVETFAHPSQLFFTDPTCLETKIESLG